MPAASSVVMGFTAVAGLGMSIAGQRSAARNAKNQYAAQNQQMAMQSMAEANAIWQSARIQAGAIEASAKKEKALFYKEAESARAIAYSNIDLMRQESVESVRRLRLDQQQVESRGRALAAASGVRMEGSIDISVKSFENENKNQLNWLDKSLKSHISHAGFEAEQMYKMYHEKANTAYATAMIGAHSILGVARVQSNLLKSQSASYSAAAGQGAIDMEARRRNTQHMINSGRSTDDHGR